MDILRRVEAAQQRKKQAQRQQAGSGTSSLTSKMSLRGKRKRARRIAPASRASNDSVTVYSEDDAAGAASAASDET